MEAVTAALAVSCHPWEMTWFPPCIEARTIQGGFRQPGCPHSPSAAAGAGLVEAVGAAGPGPRALPGAGAAARPPRPVLRQAGEGEGAQLDAALRDGAPGKGGGDWEAQRPGRGHWSSELRGVGHPKSEELARGRDGHAAHNRGPRTPHNPLSWDTEVNCERPNFVSQTADSSGGPGHLVELSVPSPQAQSRARLASPGPQEAEQADQGPQADHAQHGVKQAAASRSPPGHVSVQSSPLSPS